MLTDNLFSELRQKVYNANIDLFKSGLVKYSFGNVSGIDIERGVIAIKPSGIPYDQLTPDKIVLLDLNGKILTGSLRPSSDTDTHLVIYRKFEGVLGVSHTHSPYATAWAQSGQEIPCLGTTHADFHPHSIPCSQVLSDEAINEAYEYETGQQIIKTILAHSDVLANMVLVGGHGPFTWGNSPDQAVQHSVMLEEIARIAYLTLTISPGKTPLKQILIDKHFYRKHGKNAYYGQEEVK